MRDISEITGETEQAKSTAAPSTPANNASSTTQSRPRTNTRTRTEGHTSGSQEQENRSASRRRPTTGTSHTNNSPQEQDGRDRVEHASRSNSEEGERHHDHNERYSRNRTDGRTGEHTPRTNGERGPRPGGERGPRPAGERGPRTYDRNRPGSENGQRSDRGPRPAGSGNYGPRPQHPTGQGGPRPAGTYGRPANGAGRSGGGRPASNRFGSAPAMGTPVAERERERERGDRNRSNERTEHDGPRAPQRGGGRNQHSTGTRTPQRSTNNRSAAPHRNRQNNANRSQEHRAAPVKEKVTGPISLPPQIIVKDLADALSVTPIEIMRDLITKHGVFASINQVVDYEKAALVATDLGFEPSPITVTEGEEAEHHLSASEATAARRNEDNTVEIPPVVTIMGHVDHGKTSLLDTIRKTKVAAGEAGGITQHIGAYQVEVNGKKITFLDTPGHEAFTAMRARGAQVAHIAIIVIAADDGIMPQTREAIDHARAAKMPIIIALNKIDKPNANPDRVKQQLAEIGLVIEEYGGDIVCVPISAKKGIGIDELLEYILLVAEVQDIKANPARKATGVIIEAKLERNSGAIATVLVQQGTLKMGDNIVVGTIAGKVRAMSNDRGKRIMKAPPSTPVSILGLSEVPQAGDHLEAVADEKTAKALAQQEAERRKNESSPLGGVSLDTLYKQEGSVKELNVVLKSDVQGSSEAIKGALAKMGEENLKVRLLREGVGNISETDVHLAAASGAIIIGFNVKADDAATREAQREGVDIRYYSVIYKLIEDIQAALSGMLEPTYREVIDGHAEIIQTFKAGKIQIAGCRVGDGKLVRSSQCRVLRGKEKVYEGKFASLRRGKDDVREVASGYECGVVIEGFNEYEIGDTIEAFSQERVTAGA